MPVDPSPVERFVELEHVASALALSPDDVVALVHEGHLRGAAIGSPARWRIDRDSVDAYVEARTEEARRAALWRQSQAASFPELWGRGEVRHGD
ncbi:DNA binding domain-containing protein, excisionase family [Microbacterium sp. ru370.1]|uniref:excisionase family DNA-binding protein n=1 Tax=unclassified Microbacterium TaxID=2609290 RepID=UPI00087E1145|nr:MULTISPECIES: excisionase family DNA-binding protein [unclassified Microbacterium]SDO53274.1 DNA binding domain-containing protein, excisionase family [Microbacterium sp. ru370.1]SIT84165.1 DNA binding domain-containing protein, excisionase family [Microbacterium sp. RU1D]